MDRRIAFGNKDNTPKIALRLYKEFRPPRLKALGTNRSQLWRQHASHLSAAAWARQRQSAAIPLGTLQDDWAPRTHFIGYGDFNGRKSQVA